MKVAIHQPSYFAWMGYFHKIVWSDVFIYHDNIPIGCGKRYSRRVQVDNSGIPRWLTVPLYKHTPETKLYNLRLNNSLLWAKEHIDKLWNYYKDAKYFNTVFPFAEELILESRQITEFATFNVFITERILVFIGLDCKTLKGSLIGIQGTDKQDIIIKLIKKFNGTEYLSGIGAKVFQDDNVYKKNGIKLIYQDDSNWNQFSILDYLFKIGPGITKKILEL